MASAFPGFQGLLLLRPRVWGSPAVLHRAESLLEAPLGDSAWKWGFIQQVPWARKGLRTMRFQVGIHELLERGKGTPGNIPLGLPPPGEATPGTVFG